MNSLRHGISAIKMENMRLKQNMENMKDVHANEFCFANYCELTPITSFHMGKKKLINGREGASHLPSFFHVECLFITSSDRIRHKLEKIPSYLVTLQVGRVRRFYRHFHRHLLNQKGCRVGYILTKLEKIFTLMSLFLNF